MIVLPTGWRSAMTLRKAVTASLVVVVRGHEDRLRAHCNSERSTGSVLLLHLAEGRLAEVV